jgi:hypothetical protein
MDTRHYNSMKNSKPLNARASGREYQSFALRTRSTGAHRLSPLSSFN